MANEGIRLVDDISESVKQVLNEAKANAAAIDRKAAELHAIAMEVERRVQKIIHNADEIVRRLEDYRKREEREIDEMLKRQAKEGN